MKNKLVLKIVFIASALLSLSFSGRVHAMNYSFLSDSIDRGYFSDGYNKKVKEDVDVLEKSKSCLNLFKKSENNNNFTNSFKASDLLKLAGSVNEKIKDCFKTVKDLKECNDDVNKSRLKIKLSLELNSLLDSLKSLNEGFKNTGFSESLHSLVKSEKCDKKDLNCCMDYCDKINVALFDGCDSLEASAGIIKLQSGEELKQACYEAGFTPFGCIFKKIEEGLQDVESKYMFLMFLIQNGF